MSSFAMPVDDPVELQRCLYMGIAGRDAEVVEAALEAGADPHSYDMLADVEHDKGPMHQAAAIGLTEAIVSLWKRGVSLESRDGGTRENRPLHLAVLRGHEEAVRKLVELGADIHGKNSGDFTPMDVANRKQPHGTDKQQENMQKILQEYLDMPVVDLKNNRWVKEDLFAVDPATGLTPMDNPLMWNKLGDINDELIALNDPLTKEDLLQTGGKGCTYLELGARYGRLPKVIECLNEFDESLRAPDLVEAGTRKPSLTLEHAIHYHQLGAVFDNANWDGASMNDLRELLRALPEGSEEKIPNLHGLNNQLRRSESHGRERL